MQIGIIGLGYWGKKLLKEYVDLSKEMKIEIVACDVAHENLSFAKNLGISKVCSNYKELLNSDLSAVHIATPNDTHYQIAKDFLENGKHVLVEKPMTKSSKHANELVEIAKQRNKVLQVGHIFRFNNSINELKKLVESGKLGETHVIKLEWTDKRTPPTETDILFDLAPHPLDIINYVLGEWPSNVNSMARSYIRKKVGLEEWAFISSEFVDGKVGTIELSWITPGRKRRLVSIEGSNASVVVDTLNQKITIYNGTGLEEIPVTQNNTIKDEITHFITTINNGKFTQMINSGAVGAKVVDLIENLREGNSGSRFSVIKDVEFGEGTKVHDHVNLYKCKIGNNCKIDSFVYIEEGVTIGNNVKIRTHSFIPSGVTIEDDVFVAPGVMFTNDKYPKANGEWELLKTVVKKGAAIGAGAVILPGITIGERAIVGAGAVVTKDVSPYTIVVGNPAKVLRNVEKKE